VPAHVLASCRPLLAAIPLLTTTAGCLSTEGTPDVVEVFVGGEPESSGTFTDDGNGPFSTGTGGVRAGITPNGIEFGTAAP
jgi:hypothetical protein